MLRNPILYPSRLEHVSYVFRIPLLCHVYWSRSKALKQKSSDVGALVDWKEGFKAGNVLLLVYCFCDL
jgi:hypothetical protein